MTRPPRQNWVLPTGEIVAMRARGDVTGNRGILHRPDGTLGPARWRHPHWVICALDHPNGRYHGAMPERGWTALFFLDEAVALAAGHRPCHACRRDAAKAFVAAWTRAHGETPRVEMDRALHRARVTRKRAQVRHAAAMGALPDGAFVLWRGGAHLVRGAALLPYAPEGYGPATPRPEAATVVTVLTPRPTVAVLAAGYRPALHATALTAD